MGEENTFTFDLTTDKVTQTRVRCYDPLGFYQSDPELKRAIDQMGAGCFSPGEPERAYLESDTQADLRYRDPDAWFCKHRKNGLLFQRPDGIRVCGEDLGAFKPVVRQTT